MNITAARLSYPERLQTFFDCYWDDAIATARQLAALGHASDRPPLESLEEGSRCISCGFFLSKELSVLMLEAPNDHADLMTAETSRFHHSRCIHLSCRMPCDSRETVMLSQESYIQRIRRHKKTPVHSNEGLNYEESLFWRLPIEIRLQIYGYLQPELDEVTEIIPADLFSTCVIAETPGSATPRGIGKVHLLQLCNRIHDEALEDLYATTTFKFGTTRTLYMFLRHIGHRGRRVLRSVDVGCGTRVDAVAFALLACCEKLKSITIRLPRTTIMFPGCSLWSVEGMSTLLDISGLERVSLRSVQLDDTTRLGATEFLTEGMGDADVLKKALMRPRGTPVNVRFVNGMPDL